jgi:hypothetical protein
MLLEPLWSINAFCFGVWPEIMGGGLDVAHFWCDSFRSIAARASCGFDGPRKLCGHHDQA